LTQIAFGLVALDLAKQVAKVTFTVSFAAASSRQSR